MVSLPHKGKALKTTPQLQSTTPNVVEAPELWTPRYKGQMFTPSGVHYSEISLYNVVVSMFILHTHKKKQLPYSLELTPPSIISPPYFLLKYAAEVYLSLI